MSSMPLAAHSTPDASTGGRLVATDGRALPFMGSEIVADAAAGLARVTLRQTFRNPYAEPLRVTYQVPLPSDAAVSGFAFEFAGRRVVGVVDRKAAARERFEQALVEGRTAALLEQDRSSLFTQEVGNVPPGAEIRVELTLDQPLAWLPEGSWEWRFPTTVAPRYLGADGRVDDAARVSVDVSKTPMAPRLRLSLDVRDRSAAPTSPSHDLVVHAEASATRVGLSAEGGARLDRDVVVRWSVAQDAPRTALDVARPDASHARVGSAFGRLVLVPPRPGARSVVARDLVVLMDTSGSMSGEPLAQARAVVSALIATLGDGDTLDLVEFSTRPRRWKAAPVAATASAKAEALTWIAALRAGGGTEMRDGILEALAPLRAESQRQVILVTDGLIGFEHEIVAAIRERLPPGGRLHTLGIGSSVNRSLTGPAARAGGGVEIVCAPGEDPSEAAARLVARTDAPLVVDVTIEGTAVRAASRRVPDLYGGAPAAIPVELSPDGGTLVVRGRTPSGPWEERLLVPPTAIGSGSGAVVKGFARDRVEDLEIAGGSADAEVERLGLDFQIATRLTSWVAVAEGTSVDPRDPSRHERIPHELPHGTSVEGLGLRGAGGHGYVLAESDAGMPPVFASMAPPAPPASAPQRGKKASTAFYAVARPSSRPPEAASDAPAPEETRKEEKSAAGARHREAAPAGMARPVPPPVKGPERTLRGRIVLTRDGRVFVEITVDADGVWDPAHEAEVERPDGTKTTVWVDPSATTRADPVRKGVILRLALVFTGPIALVRIVSSGSVWVIRL